MDKFISSVSDWFNQWPDLSTSPPVIFIAGIINSYTSIVLAISSAVAFVQLLRGHEWRVTFKMLTNVLVSVLLAVAVVWSGLAYLHSDNLTAIRVGVGAVVLSALIKGVPWLWYRHSKHKKVN